MKKSKFITAWISSFIGFNSLCRAKCGETKEEEKKKPEGDQKPDGDKNPGENKTPWRKYRSSKNPVR